MPQKLHDSSRRGVSQFRIDDPLPELDIVFLGSPLHLVSRDGELRTARRADLVGLADIFLSQGFLLIRRREIQRRRARSFKDIPPDLLGDMTIVAVVFLAARVPVAAEVHVAVLLDKVELEHAHGCDVVVERGVDVPCHEEPGAVGVEEDDGGGEAVVVVDHVGEVAHGFVALVGWGRKHIGIGSRFLGGIDDVDGSLPTVQSELVSYHQVSRIAR